MMRFFINTKTQEVMAFDNTQDDLVAGLDKSIHVEIDRPANPNEKFSKGKWVPDINAIKDKRLQELGANYQTALDADVTYKNALFQADEQSLLALSIKVQAISAGWVPPVTFKWKTSKNGYVVADVQFIHGLFNCIHDRNLKLWDKYQAQKKKIQNAKTLNSINKLNTSI